MDIAERVNKQEREANEALRTHLDNIRHHTARMVTKYLKRRKNRAEFTQQVFGYNRHEFHAAIKVAVEAGRNGFTYHENSIGGDYALITKKPPDWPLHMLDLDQANLEVLHRAGFKTVSQFAEYSSYDLLWLFGIPYTESFKIDVELNKHGYKLMVM